MDNQEHYWQPKIIIGIVAFASIVISGMCLVISFGQAVTDAMSLGGTVDATDYFLLVGVLNFLVVFPALYFFVKKRYGKSYIFLIILPAIPVAFWFVTSLIHFGSAVSEPLVRSDEIKQIKDQIQIAKDANITIEAKPYSVALQEKDIVTTYEIKIPIQIKNLPSNLQKFNLSCLNLMNNGKKIEYDPRGYSLGCGLDAQQSNGHWQYTHYEHSGMRQTSELPALYVYYESKNETRVPDITSLTAHLYILGPMSEKSNKWLVEDNVITDLNLSLTKQNK